MQDDPKVTIGKGLPSAENEEKAGAAAPAVDPKRHTATDARGRRIEVVKMGPLHRLDMARVLGNDVMNPVIQSMAGPAFSVVSIDGEQVMRPKSYGELRALIDRLDEDGLEAVQNAYIDRGWIEVEDLNTPAAQAAVKN